MLELLCGTLVAVAEVEPRGAEDAAASDNALLIPEPLRFDLVRPMLPDAWELEANVLVEVPLRTDGEGRVEWAPEVEVALPGGIALELELPIEDTTVQAVKGAAQITVGRIGASTVHGAQLIVEGGTSGLEWEVSPLFLLGHRLDATWSVLGMAGFRLTTRPEDHAIGEVLFNPTVFADLSRHASTGVETNIAVATDGAFEVVVLPQVHVELFDLFMTQVGLGGRFTDRGTEVLFATRAVVSY
jgi:hypothetical protein